MSAEAGGLNLALLAQVYPGSSRQRLAADLGAAARQGANLVLLPELPLDRWIPASRRVQEEDAEAPGGPRRTCLEEAAREAGVAVLGGGIVQEPVSGTRHNTVFLVDPASPSVVSYRKLHVPDEPGFRESAHYEPGTEIPRPVAGPGLRLGLQICSDVQRPALALALAAAGAELLLVPRATPEASASRWKRVLGAIAAAGCLFVASVNRPADGGDSGIGGPSWVFGPDGEVLLEITGGSRTVRLERARIDEARAAYPGYLDVRSRLYAEAWARAEERR